MKNEEVLEETEEQKLAKKRQPIYEKWGKIVEEDKKAMAEAED